MIDIYNPWDLKVQSNPSEEKCLNCSRLTQRGRETVIETEKEGVLLFLNISIFLNISQYITVTFTRLFQRICICIFWKN